MLMKKKRFYEKPEMQVVELRQQPQILAGSSVLGANDAGLTNYGSANDDVDITEIISSGEWLWN